MDKEALKEKIEACLTENRIEMGPELIISSLELVALAVHLEKLLNIQFELDEIRNENFVSVEAILCLIQKKLT